MGRDREPAPEGIVASGKAADEGEPGVPAQPVGEHGIRGNLEATDVGDLPLALKPERDGVAVAHACEELALCHRHGELCARGRRSPVDGDSRGVERDVVCAQGQRVRARSFARPPREMALEGELARELFLLGGHLQIERRHRSDEPVVIGKRLRQIRPHGGGADDRSARIERRFVTDADVPARRHRVPSPGSRRPRRPCLLGQGPHRVAGSRPWAMRDAGPGAW